MRALSCQLDHHFLVAQSDDNQIENHNNYIKREDQDLFRLLRFDHRLLTLLALRATVFGHFLFLFTVITITFADLTLHSEAANEHMVARKNEAKHVQTHSCAACPLDKSISGIDTQRR